MANSEQLSMLQEVLQRRDVALWNNWRKSNPDVEIDLWGAELPGRAYLAGIDLTNADLTRVSFLTADLVGAELAKACLRSANLRRANLTNVDFTEADFQHADLKHADLTNANLTSAKIERADLSRTNLTGANLTGASLYATDLVGANLTDVIPGFNPEADLTRLQPYLLAHIISGRYDQSNWCGTNCCLSGAAAGYVGCEGSSGHGVIAIMLAMPDFDTGVLYLNDAQAAIAELTRHNR